MEALKMETEMDSWNDDRLDELNGRVKDGFKAVDKRFEQVDKRFEQVATRDEMAEVRADLRSLNERFDRLYYTLLVTVIIGLGSQFVN
jgi:two-component sensor histidine kinase